MRFETKIAVVLREDLTGWQETNVTAFLVSGIAATVPGVVGEPCADASGNEYLPMFVQPMLIYQADATGLRRAYERALSRGRHAGHLHAGALRDGSRRGEPGRRPRCRRRGARPGGDRLARGAQERRQDRRPSALAPVTFLSR
jgi:Protein of unknown function (DUF2000)